MNARFRWHYISVWSIVVKLEFTGVHKFWLERVTTIYVSNV